MAKPGAYFIFLNHNRYNGKGLAALLSFLRSNHPGTCPTIVIYCFYCGLFFTITYTERR
jgi:hypothetical protein